MQQGLERYGLLSSTIIQTMNLEGLPDWRVELNEVSAGVFKATAVHTLGPRIEITGTDEGRLIAEIKASATKMELEIEKKISQKRRGQ